MSIEVSKVRPLGGVVETFVKLTDVNQTDQLEIHPWSRGGDRAVFVSIRGGDVGIGLSRIFSRDDFVEAILAVFPELKRAET